jgi:hypothetical protein
MAGRAASRGEPDASWIVEDAIDYYAMPHSLTDPGVAARVGLRFGLRPSSFPDGDHALVAAGAAAAIAYRVGAPSWHFVGIEGRADYMTPWSSGAAPNGGLFAVGPYYEVAFPLLDSGLSGQ